MKTVFFMCRKINKNKLLHSIHKFNTDDYNMYMLPNMKFFYVSSCKKRGLTVYANVNNLDQPHKKTISLELLSFEYTIGVFKGQKLR